jgi:hypothetical protein
MSDLPLPETALESLTREFFEPALGTSFEIRFDDGTAHSIELSEVRNVFVGGNRDGKRQAFALSFLGAKDKYLKQGIYPLVHPALGRLSFFVVPLGPDRHSGRMQYEAIFT